MNNSSSLFLKELVYQNHFNFTHMNDKNRKNINGLSNEYEVAFRPYKLNNYDDVLQFENNLVYCKLFKRKDDTSSYIINRFEFSHFNITWFEKIYDNPSYPYYYIFLILGSIYGLMIGIYRYIKKKI